MPSPEESQAWVKWFLDFAPRLSDAHFLTALAIVFVAASLFWKFWYSRQIANASGETLQARAEAATERSRVTYWKDLAEEAEKQYKKLKEATEEKKAIATFVSAIEPDLAESFASGTPVATIVNPLDDPAEWKAQVPLADYRKLAALAFASKAGYSTSGTSFSGEHTTTSTATTSSVAFEVVAPSRKFSEALRLTLGSSPEFEQTQVVSGHIARTWCICVQNIDHDNFITNCKLYGDFSGGHHLLRDIGTLMATEKRYIEIATHHEAEFDKFIHIQAPMAGGFFAEAYDHLRLPLRGSLLRLQVTSAETRPAELICRVYVDDTGKLKMEKA
jgi:hypothetical protein